MHSQIVDPALRGTDYLDRGAFTDRCSHPGFSCVLILLLTPGQAGARRQDRHRGCVGVMKQMLSLMVLIILIAMAPAAAAADTGTGDTSPDSLEIDDGVKYRLLSSGFIPNVGQYDPGVEYVLQYQGSTVFFTRDGLVLAHTPGSAENASRDVIRQSFAGASPETNLTARGQRPGVVNYYVGNDSSQWLRDIPVYSKIVYEDLYPGIDLVYAEKNGRLKREFHV